MHIHILVDILFYVASFQENVLTIVTSFPISSDTNDTSFESPDGEETLD